MKTRNKWGNVLKLSLLIICIGILLYDLFTLIIYPFFSKQMVSLTLFGTITFILNVTIIGCILDDLFDQIKSIPSHKPKHAKDTK